MLRTETEDSLVESDGRVVWVTTMAGHTVARFGAGGIDVHTADSSACLDCVPGPCGRDEWDRFVAGVDEHHGILVGQEHRPAWL